MFGWGTTHTEDEYLKTLSPTQRQAHHVHKDKADKVRATNAARKRGSSGGGGGRGRAATKGGCRGSRDSCPGSPSDGALGQAARKRSATPTGSVFEKYLKKAAAAASTPEEKGALNAVKLGKDDPKFKLAPRGSASSVPPPASVDDRLSRNARSFARVRCFFSVAGRDCPRRHQPTHEEFSTHPGEEDWGARSEADATHEDFRKRHVKPRQADDFLESYTQLHLDEQYRSLGKDFVDLRRQVDRRHRRERNDPHGHLRRGGSGQPRLGGALVQETGDA